MRPHMMIVLAAATLLAGCSVSPETRTPVAEAGCSALGDGGARTYALCVLEGALHSEERMAADRNRSRVPQEERDNAGFRS
ncbi:MAG: hypothetical protein JWR10_554 [Rubritepida sp.]|nr:hypothetical protein [Rubritepida sp.]